ncbi:uncharacterized protein LOC106060266 isoform X4 [Biomphalaria glabrata]|uniref:Uncharacterized protein LOC106060266 isoform X4 n=1 Tax=Biomphalaria glabrata TaxID=6526 RepID=A0A9W2ZWE7_BIOGL|nr:uncharacterized protein LOC106060266 isoform X4 [Biomphalaria glabrata]
MDEDSDVDKDLDSSLLADLHHGLDSSVDDCSSVFDKEEFMALKGAQKVEENQTEGLAMDQIAMLQEMVQEMKKGFQSAVEELGKIQAKEEHDSARGKQQQQLENLTETLQEIKSQLSVLTKDVDLIKDEQKLIKEQLEEVRSNRGSSLDRRSQSDSESHQVIPIPDSELLPEEWNYKISDFPAVEDAKQTLDTSDEARTSNDSEVTSVACKSLSLTQALAEKCLRLNHMESSDEEERSTNRRVSHYTPKLSHLLLQEAANRRHSMPVVPTPENTTRDVVNAGKRQKTVKDLADSERDYCSKLWSLLNNYLTPLQSGGFFSAKELDVLIPQYMEQLYVEHCHICTGLQERLVHWTHMGTIADLFTRVTDLNSLDSILPFYQVYAEDLPTAITCLKRALLQSSEFKDFLRAIKHSSCASEDLMALIMSPVQHMPRFLLQLQQILRYTPTTHLDYPLLQTSLQRLRTFVDQLNKDVSSAMQVLSQENSLRLNGNEFQGSQLDTSLHLVTSEEDNITSARALSKSTLSHVQSEWLDDVYSHRSLQQFEDTRHHMMRPLSGHTNTLSQPDLTNINGYPQEMSGLAHFPRSQSSIPSTAVNEGLGERQYRHYKIKKVQKSPGRAHSQDYILASQSPRARPSSAIDFIGHGPQQYHYNHLTKRLYPGPLPRPHSAMGPMGMPVIDGQHRPTIISRKHLRRSQPLGSIILADVEREVVMEMACAAVSTMSRSDIPSGITNQKADNFKSTESIEGKWNKEEMAFEIKTRKDQGSSTSSPIKVSKLFHSQPKVAKILSRAGKDCCELSKDEFQQFQTSLDSARPQEPSPNNSAVCTPYTVSSQAMKGNVADRNTVQFQDVIEKQIMSQTTEVALLNKDKTLFPSDQSYSDGTIINMNKFLPPKTGQVKEISGRVKGKMRDSKSQTGESDTLLIRKFEKDQQHTASELDSRKSEKQAFKTSIFLCHKCQIGDNEQNKCTSGSGIVLSNSSNISEKHVIEKCKVCGSYWQNKDSPQTDANREYNGVDAKMNIDVPHTASEDLSCAECLKPCSNAIQSYEQSLSSQLKACQDLERQILDSEKCFKLSPSQSTSFVSKSLISSHSQHQGKGDTGIEGILNTRHEKNDHISSNNFIRIDKHDQVASNKSQKSNSGDHISNINSTKSDKNDNISGNNSSRNDTLDLVSGNNSSKSSENKITKSFFKLFLPSKSDSNSKSPKSDSNSKSLKSDSNSKSNSYGSNQVAEDPTLKTSKTSVSSAVTAPLSNIDQHISKTQISQEISSNKNGESFHLKKVKSKRKDKTKQQAVDKSEDVETLDVSKHYILKGKDFDHHYTLYYDEETAVNGDGSPGQTPPTKYKNSDNSLHSCSKKEIYRHYLKTRPANDVFRKRYKQHKSQLHFTNSNSEEHALAYRKDFPDKNLKHERSENVLQSYRQKVLPAYSDAIPLRENVLLSSCNAADTSCWSNIRPISRQCCSLEESSSPHPLLSSSFLHQSNLSKIESDRKSQDLKDSVTCDIDGQKHSTGIPVMPIILPVVGYRDGQRNTLFNFWPSYMSRTQASSGSNGHNKSDEGTPAEDALKESESEETSVKQDSTSSQLVATSACEESNSYKPRRSHLLTLSVREVKEETLPAGAVEQEDIPEQHNLTSKQDMAAKNDNLTEQSVVQFSGNLTSPNVNNKTALVATKGSASLSHGNTKEAQVSKDDLNDVESGKNDHRARFTSAFPKMYSNQSHQDKPMPVNTKQFILRTSSPCELATNPSLNQFAICNENPLLDSALFSSQYPCKNLEPSARIKPEKRSKNKVMVNIGSNDGLTTLIDHSLATHEPQARSGKHEHRYHLEGVVMRSDHKSRHARPSTAEMFRGGFNHNIPPQPYLMNRPISHPHVDSTLHHGSAIKHGTKHWSVHADLPRTSPNHLVSHKSSKTLKNDLSFRNSFFGDPKRNSPSSQSSYSVQSEGSQKTNLSKSPNHTAGEVTQVNVHATPDLLPPDSHLKDEPCCKLKDKSTKQSQSLFTRLTQSSLSFFSRDPKPNNAPK